MADKYSHKQVKKKKSHSRRMPVATPSGSSDVSSAAQVHAAGDIQKPTQVVSAKPATGRESVSAFSLNLGSELKRVGVIGGSLLVVLIVASFLIA